MDAGDPDVEARRVNPMKVMMLEFNEINWSVIDRLIEQRGRDFLPNFAALRADGSWGYQTAEERPPELDPWVTWVTVLTGVPQQVHGARVLEQAADSIRVPRLWDHVAEAGRSVGVFGSISAYPPRPVDGFVVPGPFAPGPETWPASLAAIQQVNRQYTQIQNGVRRNAGPADALALGAQLLRHGLRLRTAATIAKQLVRERVQPASRWRRPALQPLMNFDFFAHLYRKTRPDFATWHTNHAAHYMHRYWRAWDDREFGHKADADERSKYGEAVPFGYRVCDHLIGRFRDLVGDGTLLLVVSSMGQKPFRSDRYAAGKIIVRVRDIDRLLAIVGRDGVVEAVPTMVPQWNLRLPDPAARARVRRAFETARREYPSGRADSAFHVQEVDEVLTVTPIGMSEASAGVRYRLPDAVAADPAGYPIEALFAVDAPTVKQGMHDPQGLVAMVGAGVRRGLQLPASSNLDIAPTVLSALGIPVPSLMTGRVLAEAFGDASGPKDVALSMDWRARSGASQPAS